MEFKIESVLYEIIAQGKYEIDKDKLIKTLCTNFYLNKNDAINSIKEAIKVGAITENNNNIKLRLPKSIALWREK